MSSLNDEIPLAALSIPGVHDAATASVTAWTQWTRTQDLDIATLWSYGVRAFDLRPAWVDGTMGIYHDKYSAHISFPEVLSILLWELTGSGLCSAAERPAHSLGGGCIDDGEGPLNALAFNDVR